MTHIELRSVAMWPYDAAENVSYGRKFRLRSNFGILELSLYGYGVSAKNLLRSHTILSTTFGVKPVISRV